MSPKKNVSEASLNNLKESLRDKPELFEKMAEILRLSQAESAGEKLKFDDIEQALIPKIRELGREALESWAGSIEEQVSNEAKEADPTVKQREKKR